MALNRYVSLIGMCIVSIAVMAGCSNKPSDSEIAKILQETKILQGKGASNPIIMEIDYSKRDFTSSQCVQIGGPTSSKVSREENVNYLKKLESLGLIKIDQEKDEQLCVSLTTMGKEGHEGSSVYLGKTVVSTNIVSTTEPALDSRGIKIMHVTYDATYKNVFRNGLDGKKCIKLFPSLLAEDEAKEQGVAVLRLDSRGWTLDSEN